MAARRAEIEARASNHNRHVLAGLDFGEGLSRLTCVFPRGDVAGGIYKVEHVMRRSGALRRAWLGGSDFEFAIHGDRIAVHHFAMKALGQRQRKRGLPTPRWTQHHHQQRIENHDQRAPQAM